jgi:hypothetical protein
MGRTWQKRRRARVRRGLLRPRGTALALVLAMSLVGTALVGQAGAVATAPTISILDVSTLEGGPDEVNHVVSIPVQLSEASAVEVSVNFATMAGTARPLELADEASFVDYYTASGQLLFAPGETSKNIEVLIDGGGAVEADERFTVELSSPVNATIARGTATVTILNDDVPPPPEQGEVNVIPAGGGGQCVAVVGGGGCKSLDFGQQVAVDDVLYINPKQSKVQVQFVAGAAQFYGGRFDVKEVLRGDKTVLVMRLVGGSIKAKCGTGNRTTAAASSQEKTKPVRRLWGKGKGRFRTRGRYSSGTVRGTNWLTTDYCDGTETRVVAGIVRVFDFVTKKTILVKPKQSYFAKAGKID